MRLESIKRVLLAVALSLGGSACTVGALYYGLASAWHVTYRDYGASGLPRNSFEDRALIFLVMTILLWFFSVAVYLSKSTPAQLLSGITLIFLLLQTRVLLLSRPLVFPDMLAEYSRWTQFIHYWDFVMVGGSIFVIVIYGAFVYTSWRIKQKS